MNEQPQEFEFWDKYFRLDDGDQAKPYFNPVTLRRAEAGFPHSNSATIRKNTFANKWKAASREDVGGDEHWTLSAGYADIFRQKVLVKGQSVAKVPLLDLSLILFREEQFLDGDDSLALEARFKERFPQSREDFEKIFDFEPEDQAAIFAGPGDDQDYQAAIKNALVADITNFSGIAAIEEVGIDLPGDDHVLIQCQQILSFGSSGIILSGAPGTGKSYYANKIASHLVKDPSADVFRVQFHPSYGYEDFVEGYRPDEGSVSGYRIVDKIFLLACERARELNARGDFVVLVVDEINRGDPARIFGELLTYIEQSYRNIEFFLPFTGRKMTVPKNLILLGTMNPLDRSVTQVDAAFTRRFDRIELHPSREAAEAILAAASGIGNEQIEKIGEWFENVQRLVPLGLGHSYFSGVKSVEHLKLMWRHRMLPAAEHSIDIGDGSLANLKQSFEALLQRLEGALPNG
nr:AAA family ATPase [Xanthomonas campestris pv. campestris]